MPIGKDIREKVDILEEQLKQAYILALETQARLLKGEFENSSIEELLELRTSREELSKQVCDTAQQYLEVKGGKERPPHFDSYVELSSEFMDKVNTRLACEAYFYEE